MAACRIQRWSLFLSSYQYVIQYRPGHKIANADTFSRLPISNKQLNFSCEGGEVLNHLLEAIIQHRSDTGPVMIQFSLVYIISFYMVGIPAILVMIYNLTLISEMD